MSALGAREELAGAARMAAETWERLARRYLDAPERPLPWILKARCKSVSCRYRLREYVNAVLREVPRQWALRLLVSSGRFGVRVPLRLAGVMLVMGAAEGGGAGAQAIRAHLDGLTRAFGCHEGTPLERAVRCSVDSC